METTKKRKRDVDLPRIVYDATTRVFDRLFKEDSLEGMKDVVRKKLGIPAATPVQLAQLRDGQTVDLEDDDDFEAFSSSAYKSSTAKVKIIVGGGVPPVQANGVLPIQPLISEPAEKQKEKKDKKRREALDSSRDEPETIAPQATPSEGPLAKKRRVSFAEPSKKLQKELEKAAPAKDRVSSPYESEGSSEQETTPAEGTVDLDSVKDRTERRKDKKTNKHLQKLKDVESQSSKESTPAVEEDSTQSKEDKKKKRKRTKKAKDSSKGGEPEPQLAESTDRPAKKKSHKGRETDDAAGEDSSKTKKSKKRSRTAEDDSADKPESAKGATPSSSTEPLPETQTIEETEPPAKKRKHKDTVNADSGNADKPAAATTDVSHPAETVAPKTPKKSKPKSPAIVQSEESEHEAMAPSEQPSEETNTPKPKKQRRKSDAQPPVPVTPTAKQPAKKSTDSSVQHKDAPGPVPETIASTENDKAARSKTKKGSDATPVHTEAKTPKKTAKTHDTSESKEDLEEATRAAVQAILARKGISVAPTAAPATPTNKAAAPVTPASKPPPVINPTVAASSAKSAPSQTPSAAEVAAALGITDASLLQISSSDESLSAVISAKAPTARVIVPSGASQSALAKAPLSAAQIMEKAKKATMNGITETNGTTPKISAAKKKAAPPSKCPVCDEPWHVRSKCPIIKSGIRAMRKRIGELELLLASDSEDEDDSDKANNKDGISATIEELRQLIEKKTKKPRTSAANAHAEENAPAAVPAAKSVRVDASHPSTQVNIVPSSVVQHLLPDAESSSARAAPSASALRPPKPVFLIEPKTSVNHIPSSTQPLPSTQPLFTTQPLTTTTIHRPRPSQLPPPSQPPPRQSRQSMPASIPSPFDFPTLPSFADLNMVPPGVLGFAGNISSISDHDLEELMRGPKLTSQDVPSEDEDESESEDDQREPDAVLEEDDVDVPQPKNASRVEYPSSSDEDEEDESIPDGAAPSPAAVSEDTEVAQVQQMTSVGSAPTTSVAEEENEDEKEDREEKEEEPEEDADEEQEGEEEIPLAEKLKTTEKVEKAVIREEEGNEEEAEEAEEKYNAEAGEKSFQDMNLSSSSRSSGKAGDAAVNDAVSADLELPTSTPAPAATSTINSSQSSVPTAEENAEETAPVSALGPTLQAPPIANDHALDPIENDERPSSQPDAILSADDEPVPTESTPKEKVALRKSQRHGSAQPSASQPPPAIQPRTTRSRDTAAGASATQPETPATVKKTRSKLLTRISELPVPILPSTGRVTRATKSHAQAQAAAVVAATPVPATPKPTRSRAAAAVAAATPAASKIAAKAPATPAAAKASKTAAAKPASKAKQATAKPASKVTTLRTRASRLEADLESTEEEEEEEEPEKVTGKEKEVAAEAAPAEPDVSLVSWVVLPESQSGPSQNESDLQHGTADMDELMSSPSINALTKAATADREPTPQQEPLFIEAESQQSYPYSQFPLTQPQARSRSASPNDSEDEDANEVAATVVRTRASTSSQYRSLTEISSQNRFYAPRYSSQLAMAASSRKEPEDLFGTGRKDDGEESEDSETESEEDEGPVGTLRAAHFPTTRLAGVVIPPRRR